MEKAHSATNPTYASVLLGTSSDHGYLNDARIRDHGAELSSTTEPRKKDRGYDVIPDVETSAAGRSIPTDANLVITPIVDYRNASDQHLLATARSSDGQAFVELSGRYAQMVYKRVFGILRNREDTEDVVQEALCKAYAHLRKFRGSCAFSTWLTRIAINSALMVLRKRRLLSEVSIDQLGDEDQAWGDWEFPDPSPNAEQIYSRRQTTDLLTRAVKRLPPSYRSVVEQYHGQERSVQEAADTVGITLAAAKSRLRRARISVRSTLEKGASQYRTHVTTVSKSTASSSGNSLTICRRYGRMSAKHG
jgi:RNA polymerase sigma-70 factor, ECF subfamily